jgi:hypothetical protein
MISFTQLREGTLKTAVFTFGRFNPPTTGHEILVNKIVTVASRNRADAFVFLSSSQDSKKNPLDYKDKVKWMKKMFKPRGQDIFKYSREQPKDALKTASLLHDEGYEQIVMVVGSDRINEFKKLLTQYNGVKDKQFGFYDFKRIEIESAGERDPDADDATGMSASKLRNLAVDADFNKFKEGLPNTLTERDKRSLYQLLRKNMKLAVVEAQIKEKLGPGAPIGKMKNSVKDPKKAENDFVNANKPKTKAKHGADIDDILAKAAAGKSPLEKESIMMDKVTFENKEYWVGDDTKYIFEYLKEFATTKTTKEYYKRALKEVADFWGRFEMAFGAPIALWEVSKLKEHTKKAADFITLLGEDVNYDVANLSYMYKRIDGLTTNEIDISKPVRPKLQKLLGLKEWHKDRAKEGKQLEIGTDKYTQYTVDLTPGQDWDELKQKQDKSRKQQLERFEVMISKIIANRSK